MEDRTSSDTPLLGRSSNTKSRIARYAACIAALGACALIALVLNSSPKNPDTLTQGAVKYYYVPKAAMKNNKLPLHLMIPQGKGKAAVEYTLVAAPTTALDGNASAPAPAAAAPAAGGNSSSGSFVCTVDNIKAVSAKVFTDWDACLTSKDYKKPNADAKRRLLSVAGSQRTESLKWVWVADKAKPKSFLDSMWQMLPDANASAAPAPAAGAPAGAAGSKSLRDCEIDASKDVCGKLATCKDPVCTSYYNEPEIERICGICTMAAGGFFGCLASDSMVEVSGAGLMRLDEVKIGDLVEAADSLGARSFSRVYFLHDHVKQADVLQISHSSGVLELTPGHSLPIFTATCGAKFCSDAQLVPARSVRVGDRIYVSTKGDISAQVVTGISKRLSHVRYVLTESGTLVVGGGLASVRSTSAGPLETLPFLLLDKLLPGVLQAPAVAAALSTILESPALLAAQSAMDRLVELSASLGSSAGRRSLAGLPLAALAPRSL